MIRLELADPADAACLVDCLLRCADADQLDRPLRARRYRQLADALGDALDALPRPSRAHCPP